MIDIEELEAYGNELSKLKKKEKKAIDKVRKAEFALSLVREDLEMLRMSRKLDRIEP